MMHDLSPVVKNPKKILLSEITRLDKQFPKSSGRGRDPFGLTEAGKNFTKKSVAGKRSDR
jgi:hypothetical protein